ADACRRSLAAGDARQPGIWRQGRIQWRHPAEPDPAVRSDPGLGRAAGARSDRDGESVFPLGQWARERRGLHDPAVKRSRLLPTGSVRRLISLGCEGENAMTLFRTVLLWRWFWVWRLPPPSRIPACR